MFVVSMEIMGQKIRVVIDQPLPLGIVCFYTAYKPWELVINKPTCIVVYMHVAA